MTVRRYKRFLAFLFLSILLGSSFESLSYADELSATAANTRVTFIPHVNTVSPGQTLVIGILMEMDEGWHTYWKNPGDSGYPTNIEWTLPEGFNAGPIIWPNPHRLNVAPLTMYGYEGRTFLLTKIKGADNVPVGASVDIRATVKWLACRIECVPGVAEFSLTMPVAAQGGQRSPLFEQYFEEFRNHYPLDSSRWRIGGSEAPGRIIFQFTPTKDNKTVFQSIEFFPEENGLIDHTASQSFSKTAEGYQLEVIKSPTRPNAPIDSIKGLFVLSPVNPALSKQSFEHEVALKPAVSSQGNSSQDGLTLRIAIFFAFVGGLILNLMPCVLPVLSIKVLNLVESTQKDRGKSMVNALMFTLGILVSFWFLASFIVALKAAGQQVGWGFQFQSPVFVIFMAVLFFWLGLNLFGVFEIGTSLTQAENAFRHSLLLKNSFFNGVLATIVATPCTAPFMGSALGYTLLKPPVYSYLIFTFLGLGLAAPYLVLSAFPNLLRWVPKPGAWILVLKRIFGFLFMTTVVWLAWILGEQRGVDAMAALYAGLFLMAIGGWVIGQWAGVAQRKSIRWIARLCAIFLFVLGFGIALKGAQSAETLMPRHSTTDDSGWIAYSPEVVADLRSRGKAVFIDFTAQWCLSCQVNEKLVLSQRRVMDAFKEKGVILIKADWTNYDEGITKALVSYGKNSIPLYVLYGSQPGREPVILPEILTPKIVFDALGSI
ncbi:MAG TPA: thioredoxin family protein [Candidatus Omnitrophota bacterium]|nr:thioredoxin family protein [Candidatus Omnitrophota bacterium]